MLKTALNCLIVTTVQNLKLYEDRIRKVNDKMKVNILN